jgi:hypothetical protein
MQRQWASAAAREAAKKLPGTVKDLERRGLLQWDGRERTYGLHPVVRAVAAGELAAADLKRHGQRVVDFFTAQPSRPYAEAETLEDVRNGLQVVRTLLKLGQFEQAAKVYLGAFCRALGVNLEAYTESLPLLRGFFPAGLGVSPKGVGDLDVYFLRREMSIVLRALGHCEESGSILNWTLKFALRQKDLFLRLYILRFCIHSSVMFSLAALNRMATTKRMHALALEIVDRLKKMRSSRIDPRFAQELEFVAKLELFFFQSLMGTWEEASALWVVVDPMGRDWPHSVYRPGYAECLYACHRFWQGTLQECHLAEAECLAVAGKSRLVIRFLHRLRGEWRLEQGAWALAAASYQEAVRLARERSLTDATSETGLALARLQLRLAADPGAVEPLAAARQDAERLSQWRRPAHYFLARLWLALGDTEQAKHQALAAYRWAWADGEPYVRRYELSKATELLQQLNVPLPNLPPYDPANDAPFPWEAEVRALMEATRAEQQGA